MAPIIPVTWRLLFNHRYVDMVDERVRGKRYIQDDIKELSCHKPVSIAQIPSNHKLAQVVNQILSNPLNAASVRGENIQLILFGAIGTLQPCLEQTKARKVLTVDREIDHFRFYKLWWLY